MGVVLLFLFIGTAVTHNCHYCDGFLISGGSGGAVVSVGVGGSSSVGYYYTTTTGEWCRTIVARQQQKRTRSELIRQHSSKNNDNDDGDDTTHSYHNIRRRRRRRLGQDENDENRQSKNSIEFQRLMRETSINEAIVQKLFESSSSSSSSSSDRRPDFPSYTERSLVELDLLGQGAIGDGDGDGDGSRSVDGTNNNKSSSSLSSEKEATTCIFLSPSSDCDDINLSYDYHHHPPTKNRTTTTNTKPPSPEVPSLPIPLPSTTTTTSITKSKNAILKLLSFAYKSQPISKSLCLTINPLLINRDASLYDNIPWDKWTIDTDDGRNRDFVNNPIDAKYHLGKRDAYNRFMGRDWYGRSLSVENLAARVRYMMDGDDNDNREEKRESDDGGGGGEEDDDGAMMRIPTFDEAAALVLAKRVLELELKEARMAVAETEEQLAILRTSDELTSINGGDDVEAVTLERLQQQREDAINDAMQSIIDAKSFLLQVLDAMDSSSNPDDDDKVQTNKKGEQKQQQQSENFLGKFVSVLMDGPKNNKTPPTTPPYRGAMGYKPIIDTRDEMLQKSILPYSSPYELMNEIINEQLNADVIGCVIENTSYVPQAIVLGGAVVLKRRGKKKIVQIDGEDVETTDDDAEGGYGSKGGGIKAGKVFVVECDCDEAIGMALTCGLGVGVERDVWERAQTMVRLKMKDGVEVGSGSISSTHIMDVMPYLENMDKSIIIKTQGDGIPSTSTPIQISRSVSTARFESIGKRLSSNDNTDVDAFDSDNPVQSLSAYDELSITDKAQILLSLESFRGQQLPRPRTLRQDAKKKERRGEKKIKQTTSFNQLDRLLIPLIDESVRGQLFFSGSRT